MDYINYIPNEMKQIKEYQEIDKAVNPTFVSTKNDMKQVANNHYMSLLDEYGCDRLEKIMGIDGNDHLSLEMRRLYIITKANNTLPYTIRNLERKIISLLGNNNFSIEMTYSEYHLKIILFVQNFDKIEYIREHIEGMIPCNIILELLVIFNQYSLFTRFTYGELRSMTHKYMREHYFEGDE